MPCKYHSIGCTLRDIRKCIEKHEEDDKIHLPLSLQRVSLIDNEVMSL